MMENVIGIEFFRNYFWRYWGNMLYLILYLGILLYLGRYGSKLMKQIFVWPFIILLITVYNPWVMGPVLELTGWADRYSRFFWMLPVEILCAYILATLIEKQKNAGRKVVVAGFVLCMVFICGNKQIKEIPDENIYKMDNYILEISELIDEERMEEQSVVITDANVYYQIRQYDPTILMAINNTEMNLYGENYNAEIPWEEQYLSQSNACYMFMRGMEIDADIVNEIFAGRNVEFFVRNVDYYSDEYMQNLNLSYVGKTDGYEVYRCVQK